MFGFLKKKKDEPPVVQDSASGVDGSVTPPLDLPELKAGMDAPPSPSIGQAQPIKPVNIDEIMNQANMKPAENASDISPDPGTNFPMPEQSDLPDIPAMPEAPVDSMPDMPDIPGMPDSPDGSVADVPPANVPKMPTEMPQEAPKANIGETDNNPAGEKIEKIESVDDFLKEEESAPEVVEAASEEAPEEASADAMLDIGPVPEIGSSQENEDFPEPGFSTDAVAIKGSDSAYVNVQVFKEAASTMNTLSDDSKVAEEALLRIKDISLSKEKVYDRWQGDLEQIERELIQLDKLLFNI